VARATGVPVGTLRTWERRYGFPSPQRTDGGQRVYDAGVVDRLRLVSRSLDAGHRPRQVLKLSIEELERLLGQVEPASPTVRREVVDDWMQLVDELDGQALDIGFRVELSRLGGLRFLHERAVPFLVELGERWRSGDLTIYQEHHASERLRDFLVGQWRPMASAARGPTAVLACLPGEQHVLALHMVAFVLAQAGWQIVFLGADTPPDQIAAACRQPGATAVALAISVVVDPVDAREDVVALRRVLPAEVELLVGGEGAPTDLPGIVRLADLTALASWLESGNSKRAHSTEPVQ
jgi:DNA-binding transcriptional MerR regulator/methylmalonyl-CoA mutase cobalamin-binding subunit